MVSAGILNTGVDNQLSSLLAFVVSCPLSAAIFKRREY